MELRWPLRFTIAALATITSAIACHDNILGPTLPLAPEVSPQGPRPSPIEPTPLRIDHDAGVPLPSAPGPGAARPRRASVRIAEANADAGIADAGIVDAGNAGPSDANDLPPVVDGNVGIYEDAAQPLK